MRNLKYIVLALVLAFSFSACNMDIPLKDESLPTVDIVQRSELLDMVNIDYVLDDDTKQMLADCGVTVSMSDFQLTADYMAQFRLSFNTPNGSYEYKFDTAIDYTELENGKFTDIRLYWGSIKAVDGGLLITSLYNYAFLPLNEKVENFTPHHLTFIKDNGGYIVNSAKGFGRYAFVWCTAEEQGISVFTENGKMISDIVQPYFYEREQDIPFVYNGKYNGEFVSENLLMIQLEDWGTPRYQLYNIADNTLSENIYRYAEPLTVGDKEYSVYQISILNEDYYGGLALRRENGQYTGAVLYDTKDYAYFKQSPGTLAVEDDKLVFHTKVTGLRFTIDFETGSCEKDYLVTEDMLGEKLATSKDKNYSLYEYSKFSHNGYWRSYLALKNEKTGEISFVDYYRGVQNRKFTLDAGFFSNGDIYLLTDYDFEIYTTDTLKDGPIFSLGEKFPLGVAKEDGEKYNALHAARRDPVDGSFIVVFDHLPDSRYYVSEYSDKYDGVFEDRYEVALLNKDGSIIKTYVTQMYVAANGQPLNMYLSGDVLTMQNVDRETNEILQQGTLNIKTGKFTLVKEWAKKQ